MSEDRTPDEAVSSEPSESDEPEPMNRAERRAKAKGKKQAQANFAGKQPGFSPKGGGAHGHRMWSNRKSG